MGHWLFFGIGVYAFLAAFRPFLPDQPSAGLDPSWRYALSYGLEQGMRWGHDLVFTFGPLSFLSTRLFQDGFFEFALLFKVGFAVLLASHLALILARVPSHWAVFLGVMVVVAVTGTGDLDGPVLVLGVLGLVVHFRVENRAAPVVLGASALLFGVLALVKVSFLFLGTVVLATIDLDRLRHRRWPYHVVAMVAAAIGLWWAIGQQLSDIPLYLRNAAEITRGYTAAMSWWGDWVELGVYLCGWAGIALIWLIVEGERGRLWRRPLEGALYVFSVAVVTFVGFKQGFVRHDGHSIAAWILLTTVFVLVTACALARDGVGPGPWTRRFTPLIALGCGILAVIPHAYLHVALHVPVTRLVYRDLIQEPRALAAGLWHAAVDWEGTVARFQAARRAAIDRIRTENPMPALAGTVDIIPSRQAEVLAAGLDYRPRPVIQEYSVYTERLSALNRDFFLSARAPDWLLFSPGSIDGRHPASADAASWPVFLRHYRPVDLERGVLVLARREAPVAPVLDDGDMVSVRFDEPIPLPTDGGGTVLTATMVPSIAGRALSALFKLPPIHLRIAFRDGRERVYRAIPEILRSGMLVDPLIDDPRSFLLVATGEGALASQRVAAVTFEAGDIVRSVVETPFSVRLQRLDLAPLRRAQGLGDMSWFAREYIERVGALRALKVDPSVESGHPSGMVGDRFHAHAPTRLVLDVGGAARSLEVIFGIRDDAWEHGHTNGVCFRVRAQPSEEPAVTLFERCLDPIAVSEDRGDQRATIDLDFPSGGTAWLETDCRDDCSWDWSYWKGARIDPAS